MKSPTELIPVCHGAVAIRGILERIEKQESLPAIVFLEGCDLLLENANAMEHVAPFLTALQKIAAHYHIAIIASVGSAKHKVGEGYVAKRDSVFGSVAWSRMTETIAVLEYLDGNDMGCRPRSVRATPKRCTRIFQSPDGGWADGGG